MAGSFARLCEMWRGDGRLTDTQRGVRTSNVERETIEMKTIRLTAAQATVRLLIRQMTEDRRREGRLFAGVWAIFGHGNVAGLGEALYAVRDRLPTYRAHNEQAMALSAIAYAKATRRRRIMACTSSIGPGATNMVTAAASASGQPPAGAAAAERRVRQPPARSRAPADREFRRRHDQRQ